MNLTFQILTRDQDGHLQNYREATEDPAAAAETIREAARRFEDVPLYMKGVITDGAQSRTVYVNPEWELGDQPVDWGQPLK